MAQDTALGGLPDISSAPYAVGVVITTQDVLDSLSSARHRLITPLIEADVASENELGVATIELQAALSELRRCAWLLAAHPDSDMVQMRCSRAVNGARAAETHHAIADAQCLTARRELLFGVADLMSVCPECSAPLPKGIRGVCAECIVAERSAF